MLMKLPLVGKAASLRFDALEALEALEAFEALEALEALKAFEALEAMLEAEEIFYPYSFYLVGGLCF